MQATKFVIVQSVEGVPGGMLATEGNIENLLAALEVRGGKWDGKLQKAQSANGIQFREEIAGQPIVEGFAGPCYGGPGIVRYECWATYERLSA
ncbi:MAG: hypothetical protein RL684_1970 [Pseudomonadota bacterium]|jgi:hypothetical protein